MKLWKRAGPVALSLALCAGLVSPALAAHKVTIDGQEGVQEVDTVQAGVEKIGSGSGTITMDGDETVTGDGVKIDGGNVILDLNGWAITNNDRNGAAIKMTGGELTLQDSSEDKNGKVEATDRIGNGLVVSGGTFHMEGGTVMSGDGGGGLIVSGSGIANISGGTIKGGAGGLYVDEQGTATISGNATVTGQNLGVSVEDDGTAEIKGGKVEATGEAGEGVCVEGGRAKISGGTVSGKNIGVVVNGGTAEIEGGKVEATGTSGDGVYVLDGTATISGGTVSANNIGVAVFGDGKAEISGGKVEATSTSGDGVAVYDGSNAEILGGTVSGGGNGVYVSSGDVIISGGTVNGGGNGVHMGNGTAIISGGEVKATGEDGNGVFMEGSGGGTANATISGGTVSGKGTGVNMGPNCTAGISDDAIVTGKTGVQVELYSTFTMDGGTVGSTVEGGAAVDGRGTITLTGGTIYGSVPVGATIDSGVKVEAAPYVPEDTDVPDDTDPDTKPEPTPLPDPVPAPDPDQDPDQDQDPASDPLAGPASAATLLEELFRRAGASGDLWAWAVENGLIDEDADGEEIVTVTVLRAILSRYAEVFGGNAVAVEELTSLTGGDADIVRDCRAVLDEFFGE